MAIAHTTFNSYFSAFRHMMHRLVFHMLTPHTRAMGRFLIVWYDLNVIKAIAVRTFLYKPSYDFYRLWNIENSFAPYKVISLLLNQDM